MFTQRCEASGPRKTDSGAADPRGLGGTPPKNRALRTPLRVVVVATGFDMGLRAKEGAVRDAMDPHITPSPLRESPPHPPPGEW